MELERHLLIKKAIIMVEFHRKLNEMEMENTCIRWIMQKCLKKLTYLKKGFYMNWYERFTSSILNNIRTT